MENLQADIQPEGIQEPGSFSYRPRIVFYVLAIAVISALALFFVLKHKVNAPFRMQGKEQAFVISKSEGSLTIAKDLYVQGLISNPYLFYVYAYSKDLTSKIKAGDYALSAQMSMHQILDQISGNVKAKEISWREVEGWTNADIAADLDQKNIIAKKDFDAQLNFSAANFDYFGESVPQKNLEGYLFPDTYFLPQRPTAEQVINKMLANLKSKLSEQIISDAHAQSMRIYDLLTLASIVEKEVGRNTSTISEQDLATLQVERETVAGIFINRLNAGMPLQSDATLTYITKKNNPSATSADLQIDSPYNTYKYKGLPPGPIANPSLSSILAVVHYRHTDYLYFLTRKDGTAVFAKTLDEQNANKAKYLK